MVNGSDGGRGGGPDPEDPVTWPHSCVPMRANRRGKIHAVRLEQSVWLATLCNRHPHSGWQLVTDDGVVCRTCAVNYDWEVEWQRREAFRRAELDRFRRRLDLG